MKFKIALIEVPYTRGKGVFLFTSDGRVANIFRKKQLRDQSHLKNTGVLPENVCVVVPLVGG